MTAEIPLVERLASLPFSAPADPRGIPAAVLLALSPVGGADDLGLVLVRRPHSMRNHAGQVGLPGGAVEPGDRDEVAAALREAHEEVGLDPVGVRVLGTLERLYISVSNFDVLPVVGLWDGDEPLRPNPTEVAGILSPTLRQLADPANHGAVPLARLVG
ncbi:MAG TPA: CoA pyrophosphatase, partial [Actinomycetes bacterium]|nr:CoA pyrophosphatase [Actinomycetes bacterium]